MKDELKKVSDTLDQIAQKLSSADEAVLKPYIAQMKDSMEDIKKTGQENLKDKLTRLLDLTDKVKDVKVGDLPGFQPGINMIQSILKDRISKL